MTKYCLLLLLILFTFISAQITSRQATVITIDGKVLELTILQENMDSLQVNALGDTFFISKNYIKTINYAKAEMANKQITDISAPVITETFSEFKNRIHWGVEVNPFRLGGSEEGFSSASGTLCYFNLQNNTEFALPFYYSSTNLNYLPTGGHLDIATLDLRCRYYFSFLEQEQSGAYISVGIRYAHLNGSLGFKYSNENGDNPPASYIYPQDSQDKLGICSGLGVRFFTKAGFYWGASISIGAYLFGKSNRFFPDYYENYYIITPDEDHDLFIDVELLKLGWAF